MLNSQTNQSGALNLTHLQNTAANIVANGCSVIAMPLEFLLRPQFGTRYFTVPEFALTSLLMIALPVGSAVVTGLMQLIPFSHPPAPVGLFDIGSLAKLYFILLIVHGVRLYKRVLNVQSETHSHYEGPPLPIFAAIPGGMSFWKVRIILEPALIFIAATILQDLFIFQSGLTLYLRCAALALSMKGCISFLRSWETIRDLMDMASAAPVLSKLVENKATQEDLVPMHLASLPPDLPESIRNQAAVNIARAYTPNN
jgi:hypothetical protein